MTIDPGYEESSLELVEDLLDSLSPATSEAVYLGTRDVSERAIAAVAAARADAGGGGSDDQTATEVPFTPAGGISATNVQSALAELDTEKQPIDADLTTVAGLTPTNDDVLQRKSGAWANRSLSQLKSDLALTASGIALVDSGGYYSSTDVEAALAELVESAIEVIIDGGGSALTTGVKGDLEVPFDATIVSARLFADQSGSVVIDIWKDTYANFPPTNADTITASAKPTLSSAAKSQDSTLTGWTTSLTKGDVLRFNVDSATTLTRVTLSLGLTRR